MKQALWVCLLGGALAISSGCCGGPCGPCGPCGPGGPVAGPDCAPCGTPCAGPAYGPAYAGACAPCDTPCDGCGPAAGPCGPCGPYRPWGPLFWLSRLFCFGGCGCGERYWGVYSDQVDWADPCDGCGNWTGGGGCGCGGPNGFAGNGVGPGYVDGGFAKTRAAPPSEVAVAASPRPQYTATPQYATRPRYTPGPQYPAGTQYGARPQYAPRPQYTQQPQFAQQPRYATQPRTAPRMISEADQAFDPTLVTSEPSLQTSQQPQRAPSQR